MASESDRIGWMELACATFVAALAAAVLGMVLSLGGCGGTCDCECGCPYYGRTFDNDVRMCAIGLTELESRIDMLEGRVDDLEPGPGVGSEK